MKKFAVDEAESKKKLINKIEKINEIEFEVDDKEFLKYLNSQNAKILAVIFIIFFTIYHGYLNSNYGRNSCNRLLGEGHMLGNNEWQPYGCMIHKYTQDDIKTCFKYIKYYNGKSNFLFIGDFRVRQVFAAFINQYDPSYFDPEEPYSQNNLTYASKNLNLQVKFIHKSIIDESLASYIETLLHNSTNRPSFIIMGMASEYMLRNASSSEALDEFKQNLTSMVDMINSASFDMSLNSNKVETITIPRIRNPRSSRSSKSTTEKQSEKTSTSIDGASQSELSSIYWMLQDPIDESKITFNKSLREALTNQEIDRYNRAALSIIHGSALNIWSSSRLVSQGFKPSDSSPDGLRVGPATLKVDSQLLLNLYCNSRLNFAEASCCTQPESMSISQQIVFVLFFIVFCIAILLFLYKKFCSKHSMNKFRFNLSGSEISFTSAGCKNAATSIGIYTVLTTFSRLFLLLLYLYASDRADYFMKENQHFTLLTFLIPLIYVTVLGLFFHDQVPAPKIMNRQQTDEIKGFMQCVLLIYRISNAQESVPLYFLVRFFSSAYLFLSGYGHFMYYWNSSNYGIPRLFQVLFRLNFITVILCFSMNRMYQFYTFIPLVTFWFVCSYVVMATFPRVSARTAKDSPYMYLYMFIKLCVFLGFIIGLNTSDVFFQRFFMAKLWKYLFLNSDDLLSEWRERWGLDAFSFVVGMFFALFLCILKRMNIIDNSDDNQIELQQSSTELRDKIRERTRPKHVKAFFLLISITGLLSYAIFANLCRTKDACNMYISYITIIPILSFIMLRNTLDFVCEKCSYMFSWIGKISLELFVCSFHIWLAADSHGILVLLPGYPVLNVLIVTFIFICVAHELNKITRLLSHHFVPNNWRICLRNFFSFLILLFPVAIKNGYV